MCSCCCMTVCVSEFPCKYSFQERALVAFKPRPILFIMNKICLNQTITLYLLLLLLLHIYLNSLLLLLLLLLLRHIFTRPITITITLTGKYGEPITITITRNIKKAYYYYYYFPDYYYYYYFPITVTFIITMEPKKHNTSRLHLVIFKDLYHFHGITPYHRHIITDNIIIKLS